MNFMTEYRRAYAPGASWFFTANLAERNNNDLLLRRIDDLRGAFRYVKQKHPFRLDAVVVLPDHLHCIWTLPPGDTNFSMRWNLLKGRFSRSIDKGERVSQSRQKRRERGLWQRRFWEHLLRDQADFNQHIDYIHWNPVKHGWVEHVADWPHSSFHDYVARGVYAENWCSDGVFDKCVGE
jgi:putative transposase